MSDFFSPLEEDVVSRTEQSEDGERISQRARERAGGDHGQVFPVWNPEARARIAGGGGLKPRTLLVAASDLACRLVQDAVRDGGMVLRPLGSLLVDGVSSRGNAVEPDVDDSGGFIMEVPGGDVVIAAAQYDVPAAAAREWAVALLAAVAPSTVVVVGSVDEHDVDYGADGRRGAYVMDTATMHAKLRTKRADASDTATNVSETSADAASAAAAPPVPPGAMISGIAAGVLGRCEMTGLPARLVVVPAPSGTAGSRGCGGRPAARGAGGFGPGFGGGVDRAAVLHAIQLVQEATGLSLGDNGGSSGGGSKGKSYRDSMRVFV